MSSFTKNVISSESNLMTTVNSASRDSNSSTSEYLNLFTSFSGFNGAPSGFPNTLPPELRSAVLRPHFQSNSHNANNFSKHPSLSCDSPCTTVDTRDTSIAYADDSFAGNSNIAFLSRWKKCSSELHPQDQIHTGDHEVESQAANARSVDFDYRCSAVPGYYFRSNSPITSLNTKNAVGYSFPDSVSNSSWCPVSWSEQSLNRNIDKNDFEWTRPLQDPTTEVDSLFQRLEVARSWGNQGLGDGGGIVSHKNVPPPGGSVQNASVTKAPIIKEVLGRRGRNASASSSSSAGSPTTITTMDASRSINLPPGHNVETTDFDVAACLPNAIARMSFMADSPVIQQSIPSSASSVLGQKLPAVGKSHQVQPSFWPVPSSSQEGVSCSGVDSLAFSKKADAYHRPFTSDQNTQRDALGPFRNKMPGYTKVSSALGYGADDGGLDPGRQPEGPGSGRLADDQLWYYEDPQGRIQGEFSNSQMFNWLLAGRYFTSSLRIRRKCDDTFSTLHNYVQLFGHVPFSGTAQIPPIRGGITPYLILMLRMQDQLNTANAPFASLEQQQLHKLSQSKAVDGGCVMDGSGGFGENDTSCSNTAAAANQALLIKQIAETIASNSGPVSSNFNNSLLSFLSEWISKARLDPLALQEMINTAGFSNSMASSAWLPPSSQSLLLPQQQQLPNRQSLECSTSVTSNPRVGGFSNNNPRTVETTTAASAGLSVPFQSASDLNVDSRSPVISRHKSAAGKSSDSAASTYEAKSKLNAAAAAPTSKNRSPRQKYSTTGIRSDSLEGNVPGDHQPQRTASQTECSNCSAPQECSVGGTWSNKRLQFNSSFAESRVVDSTLEQSQPATSKPTNNYLMEKAATGCGTAVGKVEANKPAKQPSSFSPAMPTPTDNLSLSGHSGSTKKKAKSRQQQVILQNGIKNPGNSEVASSKKSKGGAIDNNPALSDELNVLIRWAQSALMGIELREKLDIPTFVELLTTIDAPYEVESMLIAYLGNSPRSEQFVRDFLDRRHTCWQLHRKRVEEMQNDSKLKKKSQNNQSASAVSGPNEGNVLASTAYSEANDSQVDSAWQQIKPKNSSSRRVKKGGKQRC